MYTRWSLLGSISALVIAAFPHPSNAQPTYALLGEFFLGSVAHGINDRGQVAGCWAESVNHVPGPYHARIWDNGTVTDLGTLGGASSCAYGINNRGDVVGLSDTATGTVNVFLWSGGKMNDLGALGGMIPVGINDRGQIAGNVPPKAFVLENGVLTDLGSLGGVGTLAFAINNRGQVIGVSTTDSGATHSFLWDGGSMTSLGPGWALGINDRGDVVGYKLATNTACPPAQFPRAAYWDTGEAAALGTLSQDVCPGGSSHAFAVNNRGWIVGDTPIQGSFPKPVIWKSGVASALPVGCVWGSATAINQRGQTIGSCKLKIGVPEQAFVLTP